MVRHDQDRVIRLGASVVILVTMSLLALDLLGGKAAFGQEPAEVCRGDANCDGLRDFGDINVFVAILGGAQPCNFGNADTNGDGLLNFADINPFVALIGTDCPDPNEPNEPPHADFQILEFLGGDPNDPNCYKRWDDPNDPNVVAGPIEYGLRVTLDASLSGGEDWYLYRWEFGDGMYQYVEGTPLFTRVFTEDRPINLKVYTKDRGKSAIVKKTLRVQQDFRYLGSVRPPGEAFYPSVWCQSGDWIWAVSMEDKLGALNLSVDPKEGAPLQMQLVSSEKLRVVESLGASNGYLYIANRTSGVPIYRADPARCELVGRVGVEQLAGFPADHVHILDGTMYVGSSAAGRVFVFGLDNPQGPQFIKSLPAPGTIDSIGGPGRNYVVTTIGRSGAWVLNAIDPRNPLVCALIGIPDSYGSLAAAPLSAGVGLNRSSGAQLIQVGVEYDGFGRPRGVWAREGDFVGTGTARFAMSETRMYAPVGAGYLYKYDVADPQSAYCMSKLLLSPDHVSGALVFKRSDGAQRILVGSSPEPFLVYAP